MRMKKPLLGTDGENKNKEKQKKIISFIVFLIIFFTIKIFFPYFMIVSRSMEPTIKKYNIVLTSSMYYKKHELKRNDIVVIKPNDIFNKGYWCHRVIAIEGDRVVIQNQKVFVNGKPAKFPDIYTDKDIDIIVPDGFFFQKGDNPNTIFGLVPISDIKSKVLFIK